MPLVGVAPCAAMDAPESSHQSVMFDVVVGGDANLKLGAGFTNKVMFIKVQCVYFLSLTVWFTFVFFRSSSFFFVFKDKSSKVLVAF